MTERGILQVIEKNATKVVFTGEGPKRTIDRMQKLIGCQSAELDC